MGSGYKKCVVLGCDPTYIHQMTLKSATKAKGAAVGENVSALVFPLNRQDRAQTQTEQGHSQKASASLFKM